MAEVDRILNIGDPTPGQDFGSTGGTFTLSVAPIDPQGTLQLRGLGINSFSFAGIRADRLQSSASATGSALPTAVVASERTSEPLDVMLVFDASGSMNSNDPQRLSLAAGREMLAYLRPEDRVGVMSFASSVLVRQSLTTNRTAVRNAINGISFSGLTALYRSVIEASRLLEEAPVPIMVILADGENNVSPSNRSLAVNAARGIGATIFGVGLGSSSALANIRALAAETGGTYANASDASGLQSVYDAIAVGVGQGRLIVEATGQFDQPLSPGIYRVRGDLITRIGLRSFTTPWQFDVSIP